MKEQIAAAVNSSNLQQKESHCNLDLVHALGLAAIHAPIGTLATRFIDGLHASAHKKLVYSLARKANQRIRCDRKLMIELCKQVVLENTITKCHKCGGTGELLIAELVITCKTCRGIALHRFSDAQRAQNIGLSLEIYIKHWAEIQMRVQEIFTNEYQLAIKTTKDKIYTTTY